MGDGMTTDYLFEDPEHFEEGLVHLVDMLELADPRREHSTTSQAKVQKSGVTVPVGGTLEEWKSFCLDITKRLKATRDKIPVAAGRAHIDAAIDRIELMLED